METGTGTGSIAQHTTSSRVLRFAGAMGRRRVWRTALAYAAVVFVLLQMGEIVFPAFGAPDWALRALVVSSFLGFPVVLCLAWVFDITNHGIEITDRSKEEGSNGINRSLPRLALLAVTLSIVGGMGWWTVQDTIRAESSALTAGVGCDVVLAGSEEDRMAVRSLAILPLDDFSETEGGEYFTAGLHEELVSQISQIPDARVVSRTSVVQFDRSGKAMPAIAAELGVDGVVEGSVFRSGNRVRITVQLIHGPSDTHIWANSYEGTTEDAIAFQREVAETIAAEIQAVLFGDTEPGPEPERLARSSGVDEEYLRARSEHAKGTKEGLDSAILYYRRAVEDDSSFTAAQAGLAEVQFRLGIQSASQDPGQRVAGARRLVAGSHYKEAEEALREVVRVAPEHREAWAALEQLVVLHGDFQSVVELRRQRLTQDPGDEAEWESLQKLEEGVSQGEGGFWSWKLSEMEGLAEEGVDISPVEMARAFVGIGKLDDAYPYLETAVVKGDRNLLTLWTDPGWDALRDDPRFREILRRLRENSPGWRFPLPDRP